MSNEKKKNYKQRFDDCCAQIVGLKAGNGCHNKQIYFRDDGLHGKYECKIEDYVPYYSMVQLEPVIEILKSTFGFNIDLETKRNYGTLAAYRSMVDAFLSAEDDCDNYPYETCGEREEDIEEDIAEKLVNRLCVKVMGWARGTTRVTDDIYFDEDGNMAVAAATYNPYNNIAYMEPVIDSLISSLGLRLDTGLVQTEGILGASRQLILDNIISEEDKKELLGIDKLVHQPYEACTEHPLARELTGMIEDEDIPCADKDEYDFTCVGNPQSIYWQAANILVLSDYNRYVSFYYDAVLSYQLTHNDGAESLELFEDSEIGLIQFTVIEKYLRNPTNGLGLWETVSDAHMYYPSKQDVTINNLHKHRKFLVRTCLEKLAEDYMCDKEKKFNLHCRSIVRAGEYDGYCIDLSTFNPYSDTLQLSRIVEKVIKQTMEPFSIDNFANVDIMENMREYVWVYGNEEFMNMSPLEND